MNSNNLFLTSCNWVSSVNKNLTFNVGVSVYFCIIIETGGCCLKFQAICVQLVVVTKTFPKTIFVRKIHCWCKASCDLFTQAYSCQCNCICLISTICENCFRSGNLTWTWHETRKSGYGWKGLLFFLAHRKSSWILLIWLHLKLFLCFVFYHRMWSPFGQFPTSPHE